MNWGHLCAEVGHNLAEQLALVEPRPDFNATQLLLDDLRASIFLRMMREGLPEDRAIKALDTLVQVFEDRLIALDRMPDAGHA